MWNLKPIAWLALVVAAALALWWAYSAITAKPKAEARLGRAQTTAAQESGSDAVNAVGAAADREAASDALTSSNDAEIRNAEGSHAPVAAPARDAGLRALCRRDSYRGQPECLQYADPR